MFPFACRIQGPITISTSLKTQEVAFPVDPIMTMVPCDSETRAAEARASDYGAMLAPTTADGRAVQDRPDNRARHLVRSVLGRGADERPHCALSRLSPALPSGRKVK